MSQPTFLVIGAMKAGTTTLRDQLATHPDVFMSEQKELHYFSGRNWDRGPSWYAAQFEPGADAVARGEASPSYSQRDIFPDAAERILAALPDISLVYLVRHPIERLQSMYLHQCANGRETRPITEAVTVDSYYLNASRYAWQLDAYLASIPADRVLVVTTDALADDPRATLATVFDFVGVDPHRVEIEPVRRGRTQDKRVSRPARQRLASWPGYERAVALAPERVKRTVRRMTTRPVDPSAADLPPGLEAELIDALESDLVRLRPFLGSGFDGWGLLETTR